MIDFGLARYEGTRGMSFSLDLARTADVLLYLLYSCYGETACGPSRQPRREDVASGASSFAGAARVHRSAVGTGYFRQGGI